MDQLLLWMKTTFKKNFSTKSSLCLSTITVQNESEDRNAIRAEFSDASVVIVTKSLLSCTCEKGSDVKHLCKHKAKTLNKVHVPTSLKKQQLFSKRTFHRLASMAKVADCPICLTEINCDAGSTPYICDNCGLAIHSDCCHTWEQSELGKNWNKSCFICKNTLYKFNES